ncbi:unnamed protein product [Arctia plantaginis]|uniref:MADF domain-containing protein n=1 Tax=Arctia plantaginis TaxID=874455 RepID=A0A8S0YXL8_ARCPL|nr:unnamed protein product [Arctia plantaginis]
MRTTYGRELKKVNASKQTGSGSNDIYVPSVWYYRLFEFLEGTTEPCRPGTVTLDEIQWSPEMSASTSSEQIINTEICEKEVPKVSTKISQPKKQKMSIQSRQEKLLDSAQILMTRQDDDWDIIGKSIGVQLKNLSTHQQPIAQKIINDALFYGKLGKLTDESIITLSPQHTASNPSRISHRSYHFSSGSSVTNSSPQPYYQQYPVQPSPQSSTQYMIPQSPQASLQHTSWRVFYNEYKSKLRRVKKQKAEIQATGGGPAANITLTPLQERLYDIIGRDVGEPLEGVRHNPLFT